MGRLASAFVHLDLRQASSAPSVQRTTRLARRAASHAAATCSGGIARPRWSTPFAESAATVSGARQVCPGALDSGSGLRLGGDLGRPTGASPASSVDRPTTRWPDESRGPRPSDCSSGPGPDAHRRVRRSHPVPVITVNATPVRLSTRYCEICWINSPSPR